MDDNMTFSDVRNSDTKSSHLSDPECNGQRNEIIKAVEVRMCAAVCFVCQGFLKSNTLSTHALCLNLIIFYPGAYA